ncbi:MAG: hypothetical protein KC635_15835, partial [Myxococcales bacterium]|nr:hypothetical protein [Myxococcales bacterium]
MSVVAQHPRSPITRWLSRTNSAAFSTYAIAAAFLTYLCMYGFRKPFTAGSWEGESVAIAALPPLALKSLFVISQVLGYTLSKFAGIKIVSEMSGARRGLAIVLLIGVAEGALGLFAVTPHPWSALWLFVNGLPLGMIWGLVFGYLEGRKVSEILGAGLSASYIIASGIMKSVGTWVHKDLGVSEDLMPFVSGAFFVLPLLLVVFLLSQLPPPTAEDEALRTKREPMDGAKRRAFLKRYWPGLLLLTALYFFLTAYRGVRDDFAKEIWNAVGKKGDEMAALMTGTELPIALGVMIALGFLFLVRNNRRALWVVHLLMAAGTALVGVSMALFDAGAIDAVTWMILIGLGLYLAYVPFGCVLFDRLIAAVGIVATAGFMIYVTD